MTSLLLKAGASADAVSRGGYTPLDLALLAGDTPSVCQLLVHDALWLARHLGRPQLHYADVFQRVARW